MGRVVYLIPLFVSVREVAWTGGDISLKKSPVVVHRCKYPCHRHGIVPSPTLYDEGRKQVSSPPVVPLFS